MLKYFFKILSILDRNVFHTFLLTSIPHKRILYSVLAELLVLLVDILLSFLADIVQAVQCLDLADAQVDVHLKTEIPGSSHVQEYPVNMKRLIKKCKRSGMLYCSSKVCTG